MSRWNVDVNDENGSGELAATVQLKMLQSSGVWLMNDID